MPLRCLTIQAREGPWTRHISYAGYHNHTVVRKSFGHWFINWKSLFACLFIRMMWELFDQSLSGGLQKDTKNRAKCSHFNEVHLLKKFRDYALTFESSAALTFLIGSPPDNPSFCMTTTKILRDAFFAGMQPIFLNSQHAWEYFSWIASTWQVDHVHDVSASANTKKL